MPGNTIGAIAAPSSPSCVSWLAAGYMGDANDMYGMPYAPKRRVVLLRDLEF